MPQQTNCFSHCPLFKFQTNQHLYLKSLVLVASEAINRINTQYSINE